MLLELRVILFFDCDTASWNAQCLEYDIGAQAKSIEELQTRFEVTIRAEIEESVQANETPFAQIPKAPDYFFEQWENRSGLFTPNKVPELRQEHKDQYELSNQYAIYA